MTAGFAAVTGYWRGLGRCKKATRADFFSSFQRKLESSGQTIPA
jgi:hypothetical protein